MEKLRIIVGGYIGLYPTGGATIDYIQYPLGLKQLGHEVFYIEDTMQYPIFQTGNEEWNDASGCIDYLKNTMTAFGMSDNWAYRDVASGRSFGMSEKRIIEICSTADVFINISCSTFLREEYRKIPYRMLIDSDPMYTQLQYGLELIKAPESRNWSTKALLENHNFLFTYGENINAPECKIPRFTFDWHTTRQPVCLDLWTGYNNNIQFSYSTIMNWSGRKKIKFDNEEWGQKDVEFEKFKEVPSLFPNQKFNVVVNPPLNSDSDFDAQQLSNLGWSLHKPQDVVPDAAHYRGFIKNSMAEFSVAKETYVKSNSGWFSCRSACYLASGKPVITQETGWSKYIPVGAGLFSFTGIPDIKNAINEIKDNYQKHSCAAVEIAREYFDSTKVLNEMLNKLN